MSCWFVVSHAQHPPAGDWMIFPLLIAIPVSFSVFAYGLWQVIGLKKKEQWPLIAVGLLAGIGSLGLLLLSLWVFADGM